MGFYAKYILPRIIDVGMRNPEATRLRAEWIPHARGDVLEIGIGSGLNLSFYSSQVRRVYGLDPSSELRRMALERAKGLSIDVQFLPQSAEGPAPLADSSIDTAVVTWSLCSIPDALRALREVRRVLRADGRLIFLEHGLSPDPRVAGWQDCLTPVWKCIAGGCHLNRPIDRLIEDAGFQITELRTFYIAGPRPLTWTYQGMATSAPAPRAPQS